MNSEQLLQPPPEIGIGDRLPVRPAPVVPAPARQPPFRHGVDQIARIGVKRHPARFAQCVERRDCGIEFHAVIRGRREAAAQFPAVNSIFENCAPSAGTGISLAGPVCIDDDLFHRDFPFGTTRQPTQPRGETSPGLTRSFSSSSRQSAAPVASSILRTMKAAAAASSPA